METVLQVLGTFFMLSFTNTSTTNGRKKIPSFVVVDDVSDLVKSFC